MIPHTIFIFRKYVNKELLVAPKILYLSLPPLKFVFMIQISISFILSVLLSLRGYCRNSSTRVSYGYFQTSVGCLQLIILAKWLAVMITFWESFWATLKVNYLERLAIIFSFFFSKLKFSILFYLVVLT